MRYILALALLALAACGSADPPAADTDAGVATDTGPADTGPADAGIDVPAPLCIEGTVRACACPAGRKGRERCEGATVGYGACDCGTPDAGPAEMDAGAADVPRMVDVPDGSYFRGDVGACVRCGVPNAECECVGGGLVYTCRAEYAECDGLSANGCEVHLPSNNAHCGACGDACTSGLRCVDGMCRP